MCKVLEPEPADAANGPVRREEVAARRSQAARPTAWDGSPTLVPSLRAPALTAIP